jgi:hypothetical protein
MWVGKLVEIRDIRQRLAAIVTRMIRCLSFDRSPLDH